MNGDHQLTEATADTGADRLVRVNVSNRTAPHLLAVFRIVIGRPERLDECHAANPPCGQVVAPKAWSCQNTVPISTSTHHRYRTNSGEINSPAGWLCFSGLKNVTHRP